MERAGSREQSPRPGNVPLSPGQAKLGSGKPWSAPFRRKSEEHNHEKKKQLHDYTAWVNNYLKRRVGVPLVVDLRTTLSDGITFVNLIEIIAHIQLDGVVRCPNSPTARRLNIEKVIDFLKLEGVVFQGDPVRDILDGNSKGIMRVILAVAERYQPRSIRQRSSSDAKNYPRDKEEEVRDHMTYKLHTEQETSLLKRSQSPEGNLRGMSSGTANSFSVPNMASMNVQAGTSGKAGVARSRSGYRYFGDTPPTKSPTLPGRSPGSYPFPPPSSRRGLLPQPQHFQFQQQQQQKPADPVSQTSSAETRDDTYATPADTLPPNLRARVIQTKKKTGTSSQGRHHPSKITIRSVPEEPRVRPMSSPMPYSPPAAAAADTAVLNQEMGVVLSGLEEFKTELLRLHNLLVKNSDGSELDLVVKNLVERFSEEEEKDVPIDPASTPTPTGERDDTPTQERKVIRDELLIEHTREVNSLQEKLTQANDEFTQIESECVTLRNMLEERNTFITTMKSEIYRKEYRNDTEKVELQNQILQKDAAMKKLEEDLLACRDLVARKEAEFGELSTTLEKKTEEEVEVQHEVSALKSELTQLKEVEDVLQGRVASRERKLSHLEEKLVEIQELRSKNISEDMDGVRRLMGQLRTSLPAQDPQQQVLDTLEQHISDMMNQLTERSSSPSGKRSRRHRDPDEHHRDRDKERRKRHKEKHSTHSAATVTPAVDGKAEPTTPTTPVPSDVTRVIYYIGNDKTETPYVTLVPGRSSEITLRHFKSVFDRPGVFRFYFKTEDPDCGVVKEEITRDDQILPTWKGKVLVWATEKK